jgi:hypothetical protein
MVREQRPHLPGEVVKTITNRCGAEDERDK